MFAGALVLFFVAVGLAYASGGFVMYGPDVVGVEPTGFGWSMIGVAAFTVLVMVLAALAQLIAWVAAVVDTAELPDKTWFIVLLVTGLVGVGFVAMIAYAVAGPDRKRVNEPPAPARPGHSTSEFHCRRDRFVRMMVRSRRPLLASVQTAKPQAIQESSEASSARLTAHVCRQGEHDNERDHGNNNKPEDQALSPVDRGRTGHTDAPPPRQAGIPGWPPPRTPSLTRVDRPEWRA